MTFVVIGSGPAGVTAARALSDASCPVTLLDAGDTIEAGRMGVFDALGSSDPQFWPLELAQRARDAFPVSVRHVPLKPAYGSLFPYVVDDADLPIVSESVEALASLARGGLSNAWGAAMLPVRERDIANWPIKLDELTPHYEAVLNFVPLAAEHDELSELLPLYTDSPGRLRRGPQAELVLRHLRRHAAQLQTAGFNFGASRLAVTAVVDHPNRCRYCGMCLYGCPYHSIYNSSHTLAALIDAGKVDYRGGVYVDRLTATGDSVTIHAHERGRPAAKCEFSASRVLVACGALSSTRLMMESMGSTRRACRMLDSQYFVIPMVTFGATPVSVATQGNTLAQVFLALDGERVSMRSIHLQLYGYNDLVLSSLAAQLRLGKDTIERVLQPLLGRLLVLQGYFHSDDSPGMSVTVDAGGLRLVGEQRAAGVRRVKRLVRRLAANARPLGMAPIPGLAQTGWPGKSNHLGGSFPMSHRPDAFQTDTLGRPPDWDRVHLVDASVLPSVPATTMTLSVMANAHRIAMAAASIAD
jgi:choline dehydrogenase-like flavoprotein